MAVFKGDLNMRKDEPVVTLSMKTMIRECSLRKLSNEELAKTYGDLVYKNHIHEVFGYRRFGYDFSDHMTLYNDGEHVMGYFRPSYYDFLYHILHTLGISTRDKKIVDNQDLTDRMLGQIEKLESIRENQDCKEKRLQKEFPALYHDLTHGRGYLMEVSEEEKKKFYSCGLRNNIDNFIKAQGEVYRSFVGRREAYKESVEKASYNHFIQDNFDLNKVAMYTVHEYLRVCENTEDIEKIKKYLLFIEQYKKSSFDKSVSLKSNDARFINWETLQVRIQNIEKKLRYLENQKTPLSVEWELLPKGYRVVSKEGNSKVKETLLNQEEVNRLRAAGEKKRAFYEENPCMEKVVGLSRYKGYIAYIYPNGEILLDREYHEDVLSSAVGDAIYVLHASDFERLSGKNKTDLLNEEGVERITHSRYWDSRAQKVIDREGTKENREAAKKLVLKLKER